MTTKEVKEIIKKQVTESWERLCLYTKIYGIDDEITIRTRYEWASLDVLWRKLYSDEY